MRDISVFFMILNNLLNKYSWLIWKDPDAGKDWGQEQKGMTEDEIVGWHHQLNGHGFGWTLRVGDRQGGLACYGSWGHKEWDMTERLNWTELKVATIFKINIGKLCQGYDEIVCPFTVVRSVHFFRLLDFFISSFLPVLLLMQRKFKIDSTFINQGLTFCLEKYIKKKEKKI